MFTTKNVKCAFAYTNLNNIGKNFTKNVISINNQDFFSLVNFSSDIFLHKDENYTYLNENGNISSFNYYQNIIPIERNPTFTTLEFFIDNRQLTYDNEFIIFSTYLIYSLYGINFKPYNGLSIAKINLSDQSVTYPKETKYLSFINYNENICLQNWSWKLLPGHFIYLDKIIGRLNINPTKSYLLNPFIFPYYKKIYNIFQNNDSSITCSYSLPDQYSQVTNNITLYQPVYIFSNDNGLTYFKYNSTSNAFENVSFTAGYPTFNEFLTKGNSYNEYMSISDSLWSTKLSASNNYNVSIYTNSYVPIIYIKQSSLNINKGEFLWSYERKPRRVMVKGTI